VETLNNGLSRNKMKKPGCGEDVGDRFQVKGFKYKQLILKSILNNK
jgi:hypothetical protein